MSRSLGTIVTAMVTPFDRNGELNCREAERLARWLIERGNDGLVIAGSTGEGQTLDALERMTLWESVKAAVGDSAAVIANAGTSSTRESLEMVKAAHRVGVDAILAVVPYYNKPTQSGMLAHFGALAQASPLPIVIYNIPGRTAANMLPETLLELARRHPNIRGVKESSGDLKQIGVILRDRKAGFIVWAGDDHLFLPCLALGADGVVGVASHLCSQEYRRMLDAYRGGRVGEAAEIHASLLPLIEALFATTSPIAVKWALQYLGFEVGRCRLPLDEISDPVAQRLRPLLDPYVASITHVR